MASLDEQSGAISTSDAATRAQRLRLSTSAEHKKTWGQYFTPPPLASFVASLAATNLGSTVRVLDPGAGTGALGVTLARELLGRRDVQNVELYCVESEPNACCELESALAEAKLALGRGFSATVFRRDFLDFAVPGFGAPQIPPIDIAIANPPYFKVSPKDSRGGDAPNMYARFMEVSAKLLRAGGQLCFIVPRSYASGFYFKRFRRRFHHSMQLEQVHVFESRSAAFEVDKVLQETVIVRYVKRARTGADMVAISVSEGLDDLPQRRSFSCGLSRLLPADDGAVLSLPTEPSHVELMRRIQALPQTLDGLGLQISTGPVVPFRATAHLVEDGSEATAPLLWLQHVQRGQITWPLGAKFRKAEHIKLHAGAKLLVPVSNYVLLRRFSAKEEERRLTAAPLLAADWTPSLLGLENHLNYIHRPGGELSAHEARGLAALLNSRVLDEYFRVASGNTQVSATEIRSLPLPSRQFIERLGHAATLERDTERRVERLILLESGLE